MKQWSEKTTDHARASEVCGVHGGMPHILAAFLIGVVMILIGLIVGLCLLLK